jgi:hypothetical protein
VPSTAWASGTSNAGSLRPGRTSSGAGIRVFSGFSIVISLPIRLLYVHGSEARNSVPASGYGSSIGCFLVLFALISPRLALFALFLFSNLLSRAFDSWFLPLLGFFLLPWTTLAYAVMWSSSNRVAGFEWFIVILAFCFDLASYANRGRARRG